MTSKSRIASSSGSNNSLEPPEVDEPSSNVVQPANVANDARDVPNVYDALTNRYETLGRRQVEPPVKEYTNLRTTRSRRRSVCRRLLGDTDLARVAYFSQT